MKPPARHRIAQMVARSLPEALVHVCVNSDGMARALRWLFGRHVPNEPVPVTIAAGPLKGQRMYLNLRCQKHYWHGFYEEHVTRVLQTVVKPGDVAYDVGADVGFFSLLLAHLVGPQGRVCAFEASVGSAEYLERTILENRLANVSVIRARVGAPGQVPELALDDFVFAQGHPPPRVVKIDVEGWEARVFAGMSRLLADLQPVIVLELHGPELGRALWSSLHEHQYRIERITPTGLTAATRSDFQYRHFVASPLQSSA